MKVLNKREKLLVKLCQKQNIQELTQNLFAFQELKYLLKFCQEQGDYRLSKPTQKYISINPVTKLSKKFKFLYQHKREKRRNVINKIIYKLISVLEFNRAWPKILGHIKVKNDTIVLFSRNESLIDEMQAVFEDDDFLLPQQESCKKQESEEISEIQLILQQLQILAPYLSKYITPKYLTYSEAMHIKETFYHLEDLNSENQTIISITEIYKQIVALLQDTDWIEEISNDLLQGNQLKVFVQRKIGNILLLNLWKQHIAIPKVIKYISLLTSSEINFSGNAGGLQVRFCPDLLAYLSSFKENEQASKLLYQNYFKQLITWKQIKQYYFRIIVQHFGEYETYSEEDAFNFSLQLIEEQQDKYKDELISTFKNTSVKIFINKIEKRLNYYKERNDNLDKNQQYIKLIGEKLILLSEQMLPKSTKQFQQTGLFSTRDFSRTLKRMETTQLSLNKPVESSYRTPSLMLHSQRKKICYILKCYVIWLTKLEIPDPFIFCILKCDRRVVKIELNFVVLDQLVKHDLFKRFLLEVHSLDISYGSSQDRIDRMIANDYANSLEIEYFYQIWTNLFIEQAVIIYKNRKSLCWQLGKYFNTDKFNQQFEDIWVEGDSCDRRKRLKTEFVKIKNFLLKQQQI